MGEMVGHNCSNFMGEYVEAQTIQSRTSQRLAERLYHFMSGKLISPCNLCCHMWRAVRGCLPCQMNEGKDLLSSFSSLELFILQSTEYFYINVLCIVILMRAVCFLVLYYNIFFILALTE